MNLPAALHAQAAALRVQADVLDQMAEESGSTPAPAELGPEALLDVAGACELLRCSRAKLSRLRKDGLPTVMVGDAPRFRREAVLAFLEGQ